MQIKINTPFSWLAMLGLLVGAPGCIGDIFGDDDDSVGDDDDSAGDDDDSAGDDDDSAGDDDDSADADPIMEIDAIEVGCEPDTTAANQHSNWRLILRTLGWVGTTPELFLWDNFTFGPTDGSPDRHYVDSWLPLTTFSNGDPLDPVDPLNGIGEDGEFDTWWADFGGYDDFTVANDNDGTFLRCEDSAGQPTVDLRYYMVCAEDFFYADLRHCWLCGDPATVGAPAGTNSIEFGTVGSYERDIDGDGTPEIFEATSEFDSSAGGDDNPCFLGVDVWTQ